jgi:hypothetical protein
MANLDGFDANQVDPAPDFEPIPDGKYVAAIIESEEKPTKAGTGYYLELIFQILEGVFKGRLLWDRLNLKNPNNQAVQIAQAELSAICHAVGVMRPNESCELHNLPLVIHVKRKKRQDTGEIVNEIRGYSKKEPPGPAGTAIDSTPPWRRG